jgi:hypothetical protein
MTDQSNTITTASTTDPNTNELQTRIVAVAATASDDDRRIVQKIYDEARKSDATRITGTPQMITPPMAVILFVSHNPHNRDWYPEWSLELARRMEDDQWCDANGQAVPRRST